MKDYNVLNELVPKTQELHRLIFDKGYEQGHADALNQQPCEDTVSRQAVLEQAMDYGSNTYLIPVNSVKALPSVISEEKTRWIPVSERLPIEEFKQGRKEGWVYDLYPCLVTRTASHSRENPKRIYVAKHYFDGENFVNNGEEICNEVIAWMPLPEAYKGGGKK